MVDADNVTRRKGIKRPARRGGPSSVGKRGRKRVEWIIKLKIVMQIDKRDIVGV